MRFSIEPDEGTPTVPLARLTSSSFRRKPLIQLPCAPTSWPDLIRPSRVSGYFFPSPLWGGMSERSEDRVGPLRRLHPTPAPPHKGEGNYFPLDNIPRCVYMVSICSKKEAVIAKPHLFLLIRGAAAVCPRVPEAPWQVRTAVGALSSLRFCPSAGGHQSHSVNSRN